MIKDMQGLDDLKPIVIVLSRNYSTGLGIVRALGSAGYRVYLVASTKKKGSSAIIAGSKYILGYTEIVSPDIRIDSGIAIFSHLMSHAGDNAEKKILLPTDDFTAYVVDKFYEQLKELFIIPGVYTGSTAHFMNKHVQNKMARSAGLLTPKEWTISLRCKDIDCPKEIIFPCFVKPINSLSGQKKEMKVCNNEHDLKEHLYKMRQIFSERDILVQEYIDIDKEYDMSGVCFDEKVFIPGIIEKVKVARYENGVTMSGKMLQPNVLDDYLDKVKNLMRQFHYTGIFDIELLCSKDRIYFSEINLRSGGPNFAYYLCGVNLPDILVKGMFSKELPDDKDMIKEFGKTFVYEKVAWEDYIHGFITKKELHSVLKDSDYKLLDYREDPIPGQLFNRRIRLSAMKNKLKKIFTNER